jgi:FkbM family methyltransferase
MELIETSDGLRWIACKSPPPYDYELAYNGHELDVIKKFTSTIIKSDSVCMDVGAHAGAWAIRLAQKAKTVLAIEPVPRSMKQLMYNTKVNGLKNLRFFEFALSNRTGKAKIAMLQSYGQYSLSNLGNQTLKDEIEVDVKTLDSMGPFIDRLDFIKIDIEGHEIEMLEGGMKVLKEFKPVMFIEVHGDKLLPRLKEIYKELGYTSVFHNDPAHYIISK